MSPRRRLPLRAVLTCVALGGLVNVLLAWALAMQFDPLRSTFRRSFQDWSRIPQDELDRLGSHPMAQQFSDATVIIGFEHARGAQRRIAWVQSYWMAAIIADAFDAGLEWPQIFEVQVRSGWPCLALQGIRATEIDAAFDRAHGRAADTSFKYTAMLRVGSTAPLAPSGSQRLPRYLLPLQPLWPGFAINTLLYAALAWLALFAPFAVRRAVRRRRNRCERCGYPRGASSVCSECGAMLH